MPRNVTKLLPFVDEVRVSRPDDAPWTSALRQDGLDRYRESGFPTPRTEAWKYTNLRRLAGMDFAPSEAAPEGVAIPEDHLVKIDAFRAVIINGRFQVNLSDLSGLPRGLRVEGLANMLRKSPAVLEPLLGQIAVRDNRPLTALNAAHLDDGLCVFVEKGVVLEKPIHIVSIGAPCGDEAASFHPRLLVSLGAGSVATIVESHVGKGAYFSNGVAEFVVGADAVLNHYKIQEESDEAYHLADTTLRLEDRSTYDGFTFQSGSVLARNEIYACLDGEHVDCRVNAAYLGAGKQHIDNTVFIDHVKPGSRSREVCKGVLDDQSRAVFQGKILVRKDAQKTDGFQLNKALLLSRGAEIDSKPELEIYADDVKCSHGATVGELDADALFYLRSRGIDTVAARNLLISAFVAEAVAEIQSETVRNAVSDMVQEKLEMRHEGRVNER
jgi:Fe-S cluster assembly protein SufD